MAGVMAGKLTQEGGRNKGNLRYQILVIQETASIPGVKQGTMVQELQGEAPTCLKQMPHQCLDL